MSNFKAEMHQTPLGSLQRSLRPPGWMSGVLLLWEGAKREGEKRGKRKRGVGRKGEGRGRKENKTPNDLLK